MRRFLVGLTLFVFLRPLQAAAAPLRLEARLDRTAFFVGETINYSIQVHHDSTVEFIQDRLNEESLRLDPFQVKQLSVSDSERLLTITLQLVTFETELPPPQARVPAFNLYYTRKGGAAVMTLTVPAAPIVLRSALPENSLGIRDGIVTGDLSASFWIALTIGCLGMISLAIPVARSAYRWAQDEGGVAVADRSEIRRQMANAIRALAEDSSADGPVILSFYEGLATVLRNYVGEVIGKRGGALTSEDMKRALVEAGTDAQEVRRLSELVAVADRIRYSATGVERGRELLRGVREEAIRLFES